MRNFPISEKNGEFLQHPADPFCTGLENPGSGLRASLQSATNGLRDFLTAKNRFKISR